MAAISICSDSGAPKNKVWHFPLFPHLFPIKWWDQMPWSYFSECWVLSQLFHSPFSLSSRGSLVLLPKVWCHLYIWGYWYFSQQSPSNTFFNAHILPMRERKFKKLRPCPVSHRWKAAKLVLGSSSAEETVEKSGLQGQRIWVQCLAMPCVMLWELLSLPVMGNNNQLHNMTVKVKWEKVYEEPDT